MVDNTQPATNPEVRDSDSSIVKALAPSGPVIAEATPTKALIGTFIGAMVIVFTGITTILSFVKAHKILDVMAWLQSTPGVSWIAAIGTASAIGWRLYVSAKRSVKNLLSARSADNGTALVRGEDIP